MTDIYRLVYTSRNLLQGNEDERVAVVAKILATSQRNNSKVGVTGALLFNGGSFAQVLEGPRQGVEATFERIQRDTRHSDVSVLQCEPVTARGFSNWSMAFVGQSARGRELWNEMAGRTGFDLSRIEGDKLFATLHAIVIEEEGLPAEQQPAPAIAPPAASQRQEALDVDRVRAELRERLQSERPAAPASPAASTEPREVASPEDPQATAGIEVAVLRAALTEERARTTALRSALDEAQIALALAGDRVEALLRHREVWTERAKALVAAFCQEPLGHAPDRTGAGPELSMSPFRKAS